MMFASAAALNVACHRGIGKACTAGFDVGRRSSFSRALNAPIAATTRLGVQDAVRHQALRRLSSAGCASSLQVSSMSGIRSVGSSVEGYVPVLGAGRLPMSGKAWRRLFVEDEAVDLNPLL
mmetsp:Transcript_78432/g.233624  ORF Transcript_78432/g.233624 Transcript_78432/m.233624 type:complete len:121 (-) Transcript_78432:220-582(-)|eukprot:CAMPEP_0175216366 /NCGR_PEP_ID=MMETSP0093-20121207/17692_1 /TAXON_ID=311494 /ORGANISM="Alexandrium monilatum, Strain CCMP3105" /LENGTH=120 /DNA_ID=CAMNT_0016509761 /DNA_START=96 /DNA_END=458 /DNA_ORIENTATION=+